MMVANHDFCFKGMELQSHSLFFILFFVLLLGIY